MNHSLKLSQPAVSRWTSIKDDGQVLTGHCTCMAGMGKVCSRVCDWARKVYMNKTFRYECAKIIFYLMYYL